MTTTRTCRQAMTRQTPPTARAHARAHTPHTATTAAPHNNHPLPRGPRTPRHHQRRVVLHLHRPRRPVLLGRQRRLHPSHLSHSTRAYATRRAREATARRRQRQCRPPSPSPDASTSHGKRRSLYFRATRCAHQRSSSQSAVKVRRIHQADLLGEGAEYGQSAGDQRVQPAGSEAQQVHLRLSIPMDR